MSMQKFRFKKLLSIVLAAVLLISMIPLTGSTAASYFNDVQGNEYYAEAAEMLTNLGILQGYPDGSFGADIDITRAEIVTVALRSQGLEQAAIEAQGTTAYDDVAAKHWASGYINKATELKIIEGDGNGKFRPEDNVKYEEAIKIVVGMVGLADEAIAAGGWPDGYITVAQNKQILKNVPGSKGVPAKRGAVALMVYQALSAQSGSGGSGGSNYIVKFDLNYSSPQGQIPDQSVRNGEVAQRPSTSKVKRSNYALVSWYTDKNCNNSFSFETKINENMTLYAKWVRWDDDADSYNDGVQIGNQLKEVKKKYYNDKGYIDYEDFDKAFTEVVACVQNLFEQGKIKEYDFSYDTHVVEYNQNDGEFCICMISNPEFCSGGSDVYIRTYRRDYTENIVAFSSTFLTVAQKICDVFNHEGYSIDYADYLGDNINFDTISQMSGNIILWQGHGANSKKYGLALILPIPITKDNESQRKNYKGIYKDDEAGLYFITYEFIESLPNNCFPGALIYLGTCYSLYNDQLAEAFIGRGASVVIGYKDKVSMTTERWFFDDVMTRLCSRNIITKDYDTARKAINDSKASPWGFPSQLFGLIDYHGNGNFRLSDLFDLSPPPTGVKGTAHLKENGKEISFVQGIVKITNMDTGKEYEIHLLLVFKNMFVIDCPAGNYKLAISPDGKVFYDAAIMFTVDDNQITNLGDVYAETTENQGSGSNQGSIPISNRAELEAIKNNLSGSYHLIADIDLSGAEWVPINDFTGIFDGRGYTIKNLKITAYYEHAGLFGNIEGATIKNVGLNGTYISISASPSTGYYAYAGGICGLSENGSTISNCCNTGDVSSSGYYAYAGGICGEAYDTTISNCYNTGNVSSTGYAYAGGICGEVDGTTISNCYNTGDVSSTGPSAYTGGICGEVSRSETITINNCYWSSDSAQTLDGNAQNPKKGVGIGTDTARPLTASQMQDKSSFVGFDFTSIWGISPNINSGYPFLLNLGALGNYSNGSSKTGNSSGVGNNNTNTNTNTNNNTESKYFNDLQNVSPEVVNAIDWGVENGYIAGITESEFGPNEYVERFAAAVFLCRVISIWFPNQNSSATFFNDAYIFTDWIYAAVEYGIFDPPGEANNYSFRPTDYITNSELKNAFDRISPGIVTRSDGNLVTMAEMAMYIYSYFNG